MDFFNPAITGQIYLLYGLAFFMLGVVAFMLPKYSETWHFAPHLSLLAAFSILYGTVQFIEMQKLSNPAEQLTRLSSLLLLASYLPLLEFARRTWNSTSRSVRVPAPLAYGSSSLGVGLLTPLAINPIAGLAMGSHFFVGALAALLTGVALFATPRTQGKTTILHEVWLCIIVLAFLCYSLSTLFLLQNGLHLLTWLPMHADLFNGLFGFPTQLLSATCAVAAVMGLVSLMLLSSKNSPIDATAFGWSQHAKVITDANNVILRVNNAFTAATGYTSEDAVGHKTCLLKSGRHDDNFYDAMWESINQTETWQGEIWDRRKNGEIFPSWLTINTVKNAAGTVLYYVGTHIDITDRKATEEAVERLAFFDPLTQLPNRLLLQERLKHGIEKARREGKQLALMMLDLDRFKAVNDSLGHLAGDELLQQVGERITNQLRRSDMVARLGGDEFIVLLEDITNPSDAVRIAEAIITNLSKPFKLTQSDDVWIGASIGISLYPEHGDSLEVLMDHSDKALYQAKDQGRGCFAYFSEDLTAAARERLELETRLRHAIKQQELRVFYQPKVDIASGLIVGAEALVRWEDPVKGLISPVCFIPIAEETSLIVEIGEWVLRETCYQGQFWLASGLPPITLAVNVSPHQFRRSDISALVATVLAETGFPAVQLEVELTESGLMENQDNAADILNSLRNQGIQLAIDDFGTGYSSLAYLKRFPVNVLKIDKSFIDEIPHNKDDMEIAATIIAMGHTLGFKVLAEGVETPEQLAFLLEKGCDSYQGYIKSKPVSAREFAELLRKQQRGSVIAK
ncbi:MAG: putative bifunctional diguanylate cyclase/phosphodiesterase [Methylobacter sp.]